MPHLLEHLDAWKPFTALVVGDFMLDQLVYGDAERLSADGPAPVLHARRSEHMPGGSANVCMDLAAMHGRVKALGVVGDDDNAGLLSRSLESGGIETGGLVRDASRPTTVKQNLVGLAQSRHPQKMFRVDYESREPVSGAVLRRLLERFDAEIASCDVVAIEDYNKGVCTPEVCRYVIERANKAGKPVLVDPAKLSDYSKYRGCSTITPNRNEAEFATGMKTHPGADPAHNGEVAQALLRQLDAESVVLTLDKHGALLLERGGRPLHIPTVAREVYDVTGAGDMMLAALMAARANGIGWPDAVRFANAAAGLAVEVFGVQPIPLERVHRSLITQHLPRHSKRRTLDEAAIEVAAARREGKRIVFTNGCFDIIHSGHIKLLREAGGQGDLLVVAINSDASVRRQHKGPERPIHPEDDRADVLSEMESVGIVVVFDEDTPERVLERLRPDVLCKGADYTRDRVVGGDFVESYGGRVHLIPIAEGRSTTAAVRKMKAMP